MDFGGVRAVRDVSLTVAFGERRAVIGTNGAGKTTMFRAIAGACRPTGGRIELFGRDVTGLPVSARTRMGLGRTFQTPSVLAGMTVLQNLQLAVLGRRNTQFSVQAVSHDVQQRALELLVRSGMSDLGHRTAEDLSHGQRRQVEIEMALADEPPLLMLDEPAAGLSAADRRQLTARLLALPRETTLLIIEHDMEVALRVADSVTVMHEGRVIAEGTPDEIRGNAMVHRVYLGRQAEEKQQTTAAP